MNKSLKPFDLQTALKGEPVMLRNGMKAFVRHHETELDVATQSSLIGFFLCKDERISPYAWNQHGKYRVEWESDLDIIGMYPKNPYGKWI